MRTVQSLGSFLALLVAISCGGGSGGGNDTSDEITDEDRGAILAEMSRLMSETMAHAYATTPTVEASSTPAALRPAAMEITCPPNLEHSACSCIVGEDGATCHVDVDEQELCAVSGSEFSRGTIDGTTGPGLFAIDAEVIFDLGAPSCVFSSSDRLGAEGPIAFTLTGRATQSVTTYVGRFVSPGLIVFRNGRQIGVCLIDLTVTETQTLGSGVLCGTPWPPG
jgi:hypothetical protein